MDEEAIQSILDRANELLEAGRPAETLRCLRNIADSIVEPQDRIEFASLRAWALSELGHSDDALTALEVALGEYPDSARLHSTLGVVLSNVGDLERACEALEEAVDLDPDDEVATANLALVCERLREYEQALELYERAVEIGADIDWALQRMAAVHSELGRGADAKATLRRYLSLVPEDPDPWIELAKLHSNDEEYDRAFACYREAQRLRPESALLRLNWGITAVRAGDRAMAARQLEQLRALEPGSFRNLILGALVDEANGRLQAALDGYREALQRVHGGEAGDLIFTLEMAMDCAGRNGIRENCEALFREAYTANACTVELCESYRGATGRRVRVATWYSLMVEADYRNGLVEVRDRGGNGAPATRYLRNYQVVAGDPDEAIAMVQELAQRMGERNARVREFVNSEPVQDTHVGPYEIERNTLVFAPEPEEET